MKMVARVLVVWVMLLLVPFQGFAAAGVLPCAPGMSAHSASAAQAAAMPGHDHAAMLAAQAAAAADAAHDVHVPQAAAEHADAGHAHAGDTRAGPTGADGAVADAGHAGNGGHHCGGASPCCVGAALAPSLPLATSGPRLTGKLIPLQAAAPTAVDLATPERPPRRHLA